MTKGEDTKQAILERASQLASRIGLETLTIGHLAAEMGLSKSGLFAHFGSKEALEVQVLDFTGQDYRDKVVVPAFKKDPGLPRIQALFDNWLDWVRINTHEGGCLFVQAATELDDRPGRPRDYMVKWQQLWFETLAEAARRAIAEGHLREDLDCDQFAFQFNAILFGYHNSQRMLKDPRAEGYARTAIAGLLAQSRA
ncbi:MAG: TetR/AcrR family transcriptional regulator [Candidatus Krumholzibacteria bacterium]|nr:TetR/AcrR family transcriptional regulator [Candidatus Krumholzibacteria bacterium]